MKAHPECPRRHLRLHETITAELALGFELEAVLECLHMRNGVGRGDMDTCCRWAQFGGNLLWGAPVIAAGGDALPGAPLRVGG
jgi:hypothetical protein